MTGMSTVHIPKINTAKTETSTTNTGKETKVFKTYTPTIYSTMKYVEQDGENNKNTSFHWFTYHAVVTTKSV